MKSARVFIIGFLVFFMLIPPTVRTAHAAAMNDKIFLDICIQGSLRQLNDAIRKGANVNAVNKYGVNSLMFAAGFNKSPDVLKIMRALLQKRVDVNAVDRNGMTALMYAAYYSNNPEVLRELIKSGADVNAVEKTKANALMMAATQSSNPKTLEVLIENGADIRHKDKNGYTAYDWINNNDTDLKGTRAYKLLNPASSAEPAAEASKKQQPAAAPKKQQPVAAEKKQTPVKRELSESDYKLREIWSKGSPQQINDAIKKGAKINAADIYGITPLMNAAGGNNHEAVELLISKGADVNALDEEGQTALMYALQFNNKKTDEVLENVRVLVENGANTKVRNSFGKTAHDYVVNGERYKGTNALHILAGVKVNPGQKGLTQEERAKAASKSASNIFSILMEDFATPDVECPSCYGTGQMFGWMDTPCPDCNGVGALSAGPQICPSCAGSGNAYVDGYRVEPLIPCPDCDGTGRY